MSIRLGDGMRTLFLLIKSYLAAPPPPPPFKVRYMDIVYNWERLELRGNNIEASDKWTFFILSDN